MIGRFAIAIAAGSVITLGLLWVMHVLIHSDPLDVKEPLPRPKIAWAEVREDSTVDDAPPPDRIPPPITPPPTITEVDIDPTGGGITVKVPGGASHIPRTGQALNFSAVGDGPLVAIVRVQPDYPARAAQQDLEGWVLVEFDVTEAGTVENVRVIESSHRVFERSAIRAALRFRYRPKVVDGLPQATYGIRNRFRFEMERG